MNNVFASKENYRSRRNVEYLIPAFLFVAMSIIKGNRVDIIRKVKVSNIVKLLVSDTGNMIVGETVHISGGRGIFDIR